METEVITVIGPKTCPHCRLAEKFLGKNFGTDKVVKRNLEDKDPIVQTLLNEGFSHFPVLDYKGNHYDGVRPALDDFIKKVQNGEI